MATTAGRPASNSGEIQWLEFVKGFSIFWIICDHLVWRLFISPFPISGPSNDWPPIAERIQQLAPLSGYGIWDIPLNLFRWIGGLGFEGVQLFLVASGFGLTWSLLRRGQARPDWRDYYVRRFWRIYPIWWVAHLAILTLGLLTPLTFGVDPTRPGVWASLLGLRIGAQQMYVFSASWWFVGMIIQFYAVFPFVFWLFERCGWRRFLAVMLPIGIAVRAAGLWLFDQPLAGMHYLDAWSHGAIFLSRLPEFVLGMALAGAMAEAPERVERKLSSPRLLVAAAIVLPLAILLSLLVLPSAIASVLMVCACLVLVRRLAKLVEVWTPGVMTPMRWCGVHSLSLCLVNQLFINGLIAHGSFPDATRAIAVIAGMVGGALLLEKVTTLLLRLIRGRDASTSAARPN